MAAERIQVAMCKWPSASIRRTEPSNAKAMAPAPPEYGVIGVAVASGGMAGAAKLGGPGAAAL